MPRKADCAENIYLVGPALENIHFSRLPTNGQVLQLFFHQHKISRGDIRDKAEIVSHKILAPWVHAKIPVCRSRDIVDKIMKLHKEWKAVRKHKDRKLSNAQRNAEDKFRARMIEVFNIKAPNITSVIGSPQKILLDGQFAKNRRGLILTSPRSSDSAIDANIQNENTADLTSEENGDENDQAHEGKFNYHLNSIVFE